MHGFLEMLSFYMYLDGDFRFQYTLLTTIFNFRSVQNRLWKGEWNDEDGKVTSVERGYAANCCLRVFFAVPSRTSATLLRRQQTKYLLYLNNNIMYSSVSTYCRKAVFPLWPVLPLQFILVIWLGTIWHKLYVFNLKIPSTRNLFAVCLLVNDSCEQSLPIFNRILNFNRIWLLHLLDLKW